MQHIIKFGPYICFGAVLIIFFALWAFFGGKKYNFVGLDPLHPNTCAGYTGSIYQWGNDYNENKTVISYEEPLSFANITLNEKNIKIDNSPVINMPEICIYKKEITNEILTWVQENKFLSENKRFISKGEKICCATMERIYGVKFKTVRPNWLANPETGENLEIDCYNDELKIGIEYNGEQHYKWPNFTNQTYEQFIAQVRRDMLKAELCDKNGVYLISVPYNIQSEKIPEYIISLLPETITEKLKIE